MFRVRLEGCARSRNVWRCTHLVPWPCKHDGSSDCTRSASTVSEEHVKQCYRILNIPVASNQDTVKRAFLELAKKYHPDSGHEAASMERFCEIEDAFRVLTKRNTGSTAEVDRAVEYDIRHTVAQHRQYLSFDGAGYGSPMQREKQYSQSRAQRAAQNVMEHRLSRAVASENTLMKTGDKKVKHDIKTQYGFDRLVEDLIQEAMSKGEFDNLSGKGKPLKGQNYNPYVDFTTHKINEVLINNGFTPEWITLNKDIKDEIVWMKEQLSTERATLGPLPLSDYDTLKWKNACEKLEEFTKKINSKIVSFNLIVPILSKQMFLLKFEEICDDVLKNGKFDQRIPPKLPAKMQNDDAAVELIKTVAYTISLLYKVLKSLRSPKLKE